MQSIRHKTLSQTCTDVIPVVVSRSKLIESRQFYDIAVLGNFDFASSAQHKKKTNITTIQTAQSVIDMQSVGAKS